MILELTTQQLIGIFILLGATIIYLIVCLVATCVRLKQTEKSLADETHNNIHQVDLLNRDIARLHYRLGCDYKKIDDEKLIRIKYELNTKVYIYRAGKIYKDILKEVTYKDGRTFYSTIKIKNVAFDDIFDNFDKLCEEKKINKSDIMMNAYNDNIKKQG